MRGEIWVEKYRPATLDEVVGQDDIVERLKSYVETGNIPNMLFSGPAGVGKTTCAHALSRQFYGDSWNNNFTELNASDERGIDVVRDKIKNFARTSPVGDSEYKIIFLDEADSLCLPPGTEVVTGYPSSPEIKKIEDVDDEGEPMPSVDFETNEVQSDKGKLVDSGVADFFEMELSDGRKVTASPKHPFFTVGDDGKLVEKKLMELEVGDEIADFKDDIGVSRCESEDTKEKEPRAVLDGGVREVSTVEVTDIEYSHRDKAYNITMEGTPNFVLANGILTHNTRDAQPALRRTMEMYTNTCRFILSCNYSSNIIDPIQSRCSVFRFSPVDDEAIIERLRVIAEKEDVEVTDDGFEALAFVSQGDVRRAVNALQAAAALGDEVDEEAVYTTTSTARQEEV
ncbi:MAG: AAA family ATPase, partial [Halobacteria archaeon]|nr:AAA family ATPase [Halobacteria archaeon]